MQNEIKTRVEPLIAKYIVYLLQLKLQAYDSLLPNDDDDADLRQIELDEIKGLYEFECKADGLIPQIKSFPTDESFSNDYKVCMIKFFNSMKGGRHGTQLVTLDEHCNLKKHFCFGNLPIQHVQ